METENEGEFEPRIVAFLCNWCSYAGSDIAGLQRMKYPPTVRIIRVMCSGRVEPSFILEALKDGADGVLIGGCHIGDCHYISGNKKCVARIALTKELLNQLGINPERLRLEWISSSESGKFVKIVKNFTKDLKKMGQNPLKSLE